MEMFARSVAMAAISLGMLFSTAGFAHESIPHWNRLIKVMGDKTGAYTATLSQSYDDLMPDRLAGFDAVSFNNPDEDTRACKDRDSGLRSQRQGFRWQPRPPNLQA